MKLSRRDFLKLSGITCAGVFAPRSWRQAAGRPSTDWPPGVPLGRVTESRIRLIARPHAEGARLDYRYKDDVFPILRSVVGEGFYSHNHVWFETLDGYAYSPWAQPVEFLPNASLTVVSSDGMFAEVSAPFTGARAAPDSQAPVVYRLYYSLEQARVAAHVRWHTAKRLRLARRAVGELLRRKRRGSARHVLAQRLWHAQVGGLHQLAPTGCQVALPLDSAGSAVRAGKRHRRMARRNKGHHKGLRGL
ncbi:MAG: twin-arginine translocation signal domain-containing protein [Lysobacteraceae bacterium]|nr:MAG: twin-arginine translocation signal domain-containing protein [Xanthomonadaceae bacterium]